MYKQASKLKIRFNTSKGMLTIEQLWDLELAELDELAVSLENDYKNSKGKSFLDKKTTKDKLIKLQFDVVLDVLETKIKDAEELTESSERKKHNEKIIALIAEKKDDELKGKSVKELEKMIK